MVVSVVMSVVVSGHLTLNLHRMIFILDLKRLKNPPNLTEVVPNEKEFVRLLPLPTLQLTPFQRHSGVSFRLSSEPIDLPSSLLEQKLLYSRAQRSLPTLVSIVASKLSPYFSSSVSMALSSFLTTGCRLFSSRERPRHAPPNSPQSTNSRATSSNPILTSCTWGWEEITCRIARRFHI